MELRTTDSDTIKWVDCIKAFACVLVVVGHFFQSMTKSGIVPATKGLYVFDQVIYTFHVYLFFVCSGYLYQKTGKIDTFRAYICNVKKKLIVLGTPYLVFSGIAYMLKMLAESDVNDCLEHSFFGTLFWYPLSPYWFLYALFFCYTFAAPFRTKRGWVMYTSVLLFAMRVFSKIEIGFPPISYYLKIGIYFLAGMGLVLIEDVIRKNRRTTGFMIVLLLLGYVTWTWIAKDNEAVMSYGRIAGWMIILGLCVGGILVEQRCHISLSWIRECFMPVYVMHTIFAAGVRIALMKAGIASAVIHVLFGLVISFAGPVVAYYMLKKTNYGLVIFNPYKVKWREND